MRDQAENGLIKVNHWFIGDYPSKYMQSELLFVNIADLSAAASLAVFQNYR